MKKKIIYIVLLITIIVSVILFFIFLNNRDNITEQRLGNVENLHIVQMDIHI